MIAPLLIGMKEICNTQGNLYKDVHAIIVCTSKETQNDPQVLQQRMAKSARIFWNTLQLLKEIVQRAI